MTTSSVPIGDLFELEAVSKRICIMHYAVIFAFVLISSEFDIIMWNFTTCFRNSSLIKDNCHYFFILVWFQTLMLFLFIYFFLVKHKKKNFMQLFFELNYQPVSHTKLSYEVRRHMVYFMILILWMADRWMEIAAYISKKKSTFRETIILIMTGLI